MPIDIKLFEDATKPLVERIRDFLTANQHKAYTAFEIIAALEGFTDVPTATFLIALQKSSGSKSQTWEKYVSALSELIARKEVREALVQGTTYYAYIPRNP